MPKVGLISKSHWMEDHITGKDNSLSVSPRSDIDVRIIEFHEYSNFDTFCVTLIICFVEPPNTSPQMVWFDLDAGGDFNTIDPENLMLKWDPYNLTMNLEASVTISLWGYRVSIQ